MSFRHLLSKYITHPERHSDLVLFYDENVVILKDAFPKSKVHLLVMPRDLQLTKKKPQDAFNDLKNIEAIKPYIEQATELALKMFKKRWKSVNTEDEIRILVCCHSVPSMDNLHIHVMSDDLCGDRIKNKKHYNSFNTSFAIKFDEFPLSHDDIRWKDIESLLKQDMHYKGVNYKNQFKKMREVMLNNFNKKYKSL
jgi:aprataxin